jgi:hypothetical protein
LIKLAEGGFTMGKFKADQINNVLKNSVAKTVFITLHELF